MFIGELAAVAAAVFWSVNSIVLTEATKSVGTYAVNLGRLFFASVFLIITIFFLSASFILSIEQYSLLIISGIIGLIIGDTGMLKAYEEIGPRLTMLLMSLTPPLSAIMAFIFLGEVLSVTAIIGIFVTVFGIGLVILQKKPISEKFHFTPIGIFYGIVAAAGQAGGLIFVKEAFNIGNLNEFVGAFIRIFSSTIILFLIARFSAKIKNPIVLFSQDKKALGNTILASILGPYLGITASLIAVSNTYVGIASTLMATVPVLMLPISKYYYKEKLSWKSIAGAIIAVIGVTIIFIN